MEATTQAKIDTWLNGPYDEETKAEIKKFIAANESEALGDAFYRDLEFGTGGLRGIMGARPGDIPPLIHFIEFVRPAAETSRRRVIDPA